MANGSEPRRLPTIAWVAAAVALTAAIFGGVIFHLTHARRVVDGPLALPALQIARPAVAAPQVAAPQVAAPQVAAPQVAAPQPAVAAPAVAPATSQPPLARPDHHTRAGEKLLRHGKPAAALAAFQQTIAQNPNDVIALRGACIALGKLGRMNDGARVCRRALERAPDDVETRRALATIYYDGGAYKWSATEWRRVVAHAPRDARARRALRNAEARSDRG